MIKKDAGTGASSILAGFARLNPLNLMTRDGNLKRLLVITILVFVTMSLLRPDLFFTFDNFSSMAFQFPEFGLLAIAIMLTMLSGGIDLSVVGIANFSGILAAIVLTRLMPADAGASTVLLYCFLGIAVSLATGLICGLLNGVLVAGAGIPPILATMGTMQLFTGIAIVITQGAAVFGVPELIANMGNGTLWIFPIPFLIFLAFAIAFAIILNRTAFGLKLYLMGTNATASRFSGINNTIITVKTYALSGLMSSAAGLVMLARTNSAKADYGSSYTLQALLVAILGGINPSGGFGTIFGLVLAILSLQFLSSGFNMLRFSNFFKEFVWGAALLLVMVINYVSNQRAERSKQRQQAAMNQSGQALP